MITARLQHPHGRCNWPARFIFMAPVFVICSLRWPTRAIWVASTERRTRELAGVHFG